MQNSMLPLVYPILSIDPHLSDEAFELQLNGFLAADIELLQLRTKGLTDRELLYKAERCRLRCLETNTKLIINDRADIACLVEADGVHLGQSDLPAADVRSFIGPKRMLGLSCHNLKQVETAISFGCLDYLGYGPIFPTGSKANPDPVVGLAELTEACALAERSPNGLPVVAIGGISLDKLASVLNAGASSVAMISALVQGNNVEANIREAVSYAS